jgi:TolB-like protein/class 3 adenylate cyclase/cytochrome c-type biogenesis protein CcmH/NrfG
MSATGVGPDLAGKAAGGRRLIAIVYADMVGYSRLIGLDDVGTLRRLRTLRRALIDPAIREFGGQVVQTGGDSLLVAFDSIDGAVRCAVKVQQQVPVYDGDQPPDRRIRFRVGINIGDVIADGTDLHGEGTNIAARLEATSPVGGICVSRAVRDHVHGRLDLAFEPIGELALKNIARPVEAFVLRLDVEAEQLTKEGALAGVLRRLAWRQTWPAAAALTGLLVIACGIWFIVTPAKAPSRDVPIPRFSIVVLPFTNLSGDPGQDYLGDVITEGLTTSLARIKTSFVIARSTAFTYKGKPIDVKQIGKDLGVRYVLEGSAEKAGNRVRVNAQLIDAATGAHLWADQFDADRTDLLQMQDEIITRLSRAMEIQLAAVDVARTTRARPDNLDAEDLAERCVAGLYNAESDPARIAAAFSLCERALQTDSRNVVALSLLAFKYIIPAINAQSANPQADIREADELATRALAIDPGSYVAHLAKAYVLIAQNRAEEGIVEAERSLALNPSFINAYWALAEASNFAGRPDRALEFSDTAIRLSPRDPLLWAFYHDKGWAFFMKGQYDQAIEWLRRATAIAPSVKFTQLRLASALALTGHEAEAHEALRRYLGLAGVNSTTIAQLRAGQLAIADNPVWVEYNERLFDGLRKAGMAE